MLRIQNTVPVHLIVSCCCSPPYLTQFFKCFFFDRVSGRLWISVFEIVLPSMSTAFSSTLSCPLDLSIDSSLDGGLPHDFPAFAVSRYVVSYPQVTYCTNVGVSICEHPLGPHRLCNWSFWPRYLSYNYLDR